MVWKTAKADEKLALVRDINRVETAYKFSPDESTVEILDLPFYPGGRLVSLARGNIKGKPLFYVALPKEVVALDGSVANIHYLNKEAPLKLDAQTIADYLKFRVYFTKQGALEGVLATEVPGGFNASVRIVDRDAVYEATLGINPRGEVSNLARNQVSPNGKAPPEKFSF
jgi:hypothetical protein